MKAYFKSKLGQVIRKSIATDDSKGDIYARRYNLEVLKVSDDGEVTVEVNSVDLSPSGFSEDGTDNYFGEFTTRIGSNSKRAIITNILVEADPKFNSEYDIAKSYSNNLR